MIEKEEEHDSPFSVLRILRRPEQNHFEDELIDRLDSLREARRVVLRVVFGREVWPASVVADAIRVLAGLEPLDRHEGQKGRERRRKNRASLTVERGEATTTDGG